MEAEGFPSWRLHTVTSNLSFEVPNWHLKVGDCWRLRRAEKSAARTPPCPTNIRTPGRGSPRHRAAEPAG
jgi:hypothetical protein